MAVWAIQYWSDAGLVGKVVPADSKSAALALAGVPASRVVKVTRRLWSATDAFAGLSSAPSPKTQVLFLSRALALFAGGASAKVNDLITSLPELERLSRKRLEALRDDIELSTKLRHLGFDAEIVAMIESGEKTGRLPRAIETSLTYLKKNLEVAQKSSKQFVFGALLIGISLALFLTLPLLLAEPMDMLRNLSDVRINLTAATYVLLFVRSAVADYWWLLVGAVSAATALAWKFRYQLSSLSLFRAFGALERTRRSIRFLIVWRAFRVASVPLEEQTTMLSAAIGARAAAHVAAGLKRGEALTDTLDQRFFSPTLALTAAGLSQVSVGTFSKIVDMLLASLHEERQLSASRVAAAMYACGATLAMATVALLAFGLIFPIMSTSAGVS